MTSARTAATALCVLVTLGAAPAADAAVQVGQTFPPATNCGSISTWLQSTSPNASYTVPSPGVITSWSFEATASPPAQMKLKLARPAGSETFTIVAESVLETITPSQLNTFSTRIPVLGGELLGSYNASQGPCVTANVSGFEASVGSGDQPVGSTAMYTPLSEKLDIAAILEPDCDHDGLGDETQDPGLTAPNCPQLGPQPKADRSLTLDASTNKVKKGKKVLLSGRLDAPGNEAACESGQTVELERRKPSQSVFTTVEQLQTTAAGNFSAKEKVKKTYEYRAEVTASADCQPGVSNTEKVKVKKK